MNDKGLQLDRQRHLQPVWGLGAVDEGGFRRYLGEQIHLSPDQIESWDVLPFDVQPAALSGPNEELVSGARLDNLVSCHAGLCALIAVSASAPAGAPPRHTPVLALFDHEEVGSTSATGANGALLGRILERITLAAGGTATTTCAPLAGSHCISADMAHATHPNYPERHDPDHPVRLDGGPVIKINAQQRYASEAVGEASFAAACRARRRAGATVREQQHHAVRLHHRSAHGRQPRHPHPRRRRRPARHALDPGAVRVSRPAPPHPGARRHPARLVTRSVRLRPWQKRALDQLAGSARPDFLAVATPGAGKTTFALTAVRRSASRSTRGRRVVVVAPTAHLKRQWAEAAARFDLHLEHQWSPLDGALPADVHGVVTTYQQVASAAPRCAAIARDGLVVFDELHHAGDDRAWGDGVRAAFAGASRRLALSGTPFRSDSAAIPFVDYDARRGACPTTSTATARRSPTPTWCARS